MDKFAFYAEWYRGKPEATTTHTHECSGCRQWYPPDLVMIMQDRPDFDWQGYLQTYCWPCMRYGPNQWDNVTNSWKTYFRKMMIHPSVFGHDKADEPGIKEQTEKGRRIAKGLLDKREQTTYHQGKRTKAQPNPKRGKGRGK